MEILPSDLGTTWCVEVVHARATANSSGHRQRRFGLVRSGLASQIGKGKLNPFTRFWTGGTNLSDPAKTEIIKGMSNTIGGSVGGLIGGSTGLIAPTVIGFTQGKLEMGIFAGSIWLVMVTMGIVLPRLMLQRWINTAVTMADIESLLEGKEDSLERAFLTLVRDAIRQEITPEAAVEVKKAIRALSEAIERLPPINTVGDTDPVALRREADLVQAQAEAESDPVTAASLSRQAEAIRRSAASAERATLILRRNAALRKELAAQTEALRLGLASIFAGTGDMTEVTRLAEQVRGVANEANAVADAKNELEAFLATAGMAGKDRGMESDVRNVSSSVTPSVTPVRETDTAPVQTVGRR